MGFQAPSVPDSMDTVESCSPMRVRLTKGTLDLAGRKLLVFIEDRTIWDELRGFRGLLVSRWCSGAVECAASMP